MHILVRIKFFGYNFAFRMVDITNVLWARFAEIVKNYRNIDSTKHQRKRDFIYLHFSSLKCSDDNTPSPNSPKIEILFENLLLAMHCDGTSSIYFEEKIPNF